MPFYGTIMVSLCIFGSVILCLLLVQGTTVAEGRSEPITTRDPAETLRNLCPNLTRVNDVSSYRYNEHDRECYTINQQGPCGKNKNMLFYPKDAVNGYCDCDFNSKRILLYHAATKKCYFIFKTGYCKQKQWLDITREGRPICTANPCYKNKRTSEFVLFKQNCTELGQGHPNCEPSQKIGFEKGSRLPKCTTSFTSFSIGVPASPCPVGSVNALGGMCQPPFDFD